MNKEQINRELAEIAGIEKIVEWYLAISPLKPIITYPEKSLAVSWLKVKKDESPEVFKDYTVHKHEYYKDWSPTTDLNQIFKYLLPVLNWNISTYQSDDKRYFEITLTHRIEGGLRDGEWLEVQRRTKNEDPDKIPETICKAILEAWEKIDGTYTCNVCKKKLDKKANYCLSCYGDLLANGDEDEHDE